VSRKQLLQTGIIGVGTVSIALFGLSAAGQKQNAVTATAGQPQNPAAKAVAVSPMFETKVRPLLLASCVGCHGKENPGGGLRLDVAVTPEKAQELVRRIKGEGGKARMPIGAPLSAEKIGVLEQWVKEGAVWPVGGKTVSGPTLMERGKTHWAFQPVARRAVPKPKQSAWVRNPIDAFILQGLEAKGLRPSPTATRRELIRRLSYDLLGLPPTPEEVATFEADKAPDAYEKLVDRLLASPHYGEKWGRHWLDLVRYAETNSYERDNPKPNITKYRDYVIRAFNADKPYDRFLTEQLAGDEMPHASADALTATAYYRLGIWDDEPADVKQAEFDDLDDLVTTTGQAFLGLTLDCARCHDHKLDPIPQKDYYRFASFFRNINRFKNGGPTDERACFDTPEQRQDYERRLAERDAKSKAKQAEIAAIDGEFRKRFSTLLKPGDLTDLRYRYFEGMWPKLPDFDALSPAGTGVLNANVVTIAPRKRDDNIGFVFEGTLNIAQEGDYTFLLDSDDGSRLFLDGKKVVEKITDGGQGQEKQGKVHLAAGHARFRLEFFNGGAEFGLSLGWSGPGFTRRPLSALESCDERGYPTLRNAQLPILLGADKAKLLEALVKEKATLDTQDVMTEKVLVVSETGPKAPDMFLLQRGDITTPGDKVEPGFPLCAAGGPAVIPPPPPGATTTGRRTALANWLSAPSNPLTARVMVNRIWQHHFGHGIVRTPNDFGLTGARPTHPALLDWLANEFVTQGWSFKKMHRLILTSNAYKQSSAPNAKGLARDPINDLCWRFDMRRLDAEEIRDSVLAVCGNLNPTLFGPSIYPEIPKEILAGQSVPGADWYTAKMKPEDLNRRSIYIHVKRSLIYPLLASFDLPETDRTTPFRFTSTQPTQALSMMNGPLLNKQAEVLAARVRHEAGTDAHAFTRRLFALVMQRIPTEKEIAEGMALMARLQRSGAKPEQAQNYLSLMALNLNEFVYVD
jgi:cytochrome c553